MVRIGIVAPIWLPDYGGGEQYVDRLVRILQDRLGAEIYILTCSRSEGDGFTGVSQIPEDRVWRVERGDFTKMIWESQWTLDFNSWFEKVDPEHIIFASPATFNSGSIEHISAVFNRLRQIGLNYGFVHYDLGFTTTRIHAQTLMAGGDWDDAREAFKLEIKTAQDEGSEDAFNTDFEIPTVHRPDYLISCSQWSLDHLNPFNESAGFVFRPYMDFDHYAESVEPFEGKRASIGFVNPITHKGGHIAYNVALADRDTSNLWLRGGYSNESKRRLMELVEPSIASGECDLEILDFVPDIRSFFASIDLLLFPSKFEGYGMVPVEAMACGVPVVSTNHPATVEGVGEGAFTLSPFDDSDTWSLAVEMVLEDRDEWVAKAAARVEELRDAQEMAVNDLIAFVQDFL